MAHLVALVEKRDPLPKGLEPRPLDEAEEDETFLSLVEVIVEARPDSLLVASPFVWPLAKIMPVRLSRLGVGEAADVTRTPELWCCCRVAAISDCQAINLQEIKQMKINFYVVSGEQSNTLVAEIILWETTVRNPSIFNSKLIFY